MAGPVESSRDAAASVLAGLKAAADPANVAGMARFGISSAGTLGVPTPTIWALAKEARRGVGNDPDARHDVAALLWDSGVHEARIAASDVDVPQLVTRDQMEAWVVQIDSWDVCDQLCMKLWWAVPGAWDVAIDWAGREESYVKRAAFALMARFATKRKELAANDFAPLLSLVERESCDGRNEVKKAANWALRQIGKRDAESNALAIASGERILELHGECASARWIAHDALRELRGPAVRRRLGLED